MTMKKTSPNFQHDLSWHIEHVCDRSHMQMNSWKLVMWQETDVGHELVLTSFDVTHPSLATVNFLFKNIFLAATAPVLLVLASLLPATLRAHSTSRPCPRGPQEETSDCWWAHPKETLHCCQVTLVVFSSACSDWIYTGHHLLCPLLMAMLAKSQSQTEWASPQESRSLLWPSTNPMWTLTSRVWWELPQVAESRLTTDFTTWLQRDRLREGLLKAFN